MSLAPDPERRRGRPKDAALAERVLRAAKALLVERGWAGTSMADVAAAAGVSKPTLYSHFQNKDELFVAVVDFVRFKFADHLGEVCDYGEDGDDDDDRAVACFLIRMRELCRGRGAIEVERALIAEARERPAFAARGHDSLFVVPAARLRAHLSARGDDGDDDDVAAALIGAVVLPVVVGGLFGAARAPFEFPPHPQVFDDDDVAAVCAVVRRLRSR